MAMESTKQIRKKQLLLFLGGVGSFMTLIFLGMWISDPDRGNGGDLEQKSKAKDISKDYRITSQNVISPEENWVALSEKEMSLLKTENNDLKKKLEELNNKMTALEQTKKGDENFKLSNPLPSGDSRIPIPLPPVPSFPMEGGEVGASAGNHPIERLGGDRGEETKLDLGGVPVI